MIKYKPIDNQNTAEILSRFPEGTTYMDHTLPTSPRSSDINIPRLFFLFPNGDELSINVSYDTIHGKITLNAQVDNPEIYNNYPVAEEFVESLKFNLPFGMSMTEGLRLVEASMYKVRVLVGQHLPVYETKNT